jgi:hypothetical protein
MLIAQLATLKMPWTGMYRLVLQTVCIKAAQQPTTRVSERVKLAVPINTKRKLADIVLSVPGRRTFIVEATRLNPRYAKKRRMFDEDQRYAPTDSMIKPATAMQAIKVLALIGKSCRESMSSFPLE